MNTIGIVLIVIAVIILTIVILFAVLMDMRIKWLKAGSDPDKCPVKDKGLKDFVCGPVPKPKTQTTTTTKKTKKRKVVKKEPEEDQEEYQ
jgi:hypothetical protein